MLVALWWLNIAHADDIVLSLRNIKTKAWGNIVPGKPCDPRNKIWRFKYKIDLGIPTYVSFEGRSACQSDPERDT